MALRLPVSALSALLCQICHEYLYPPVQKCGLCDLALCPRCVRALDDLCPCCEAIFEPVVCLDLNRVLKENLVLCQFRHCSFRSTAAEMREHMKVCSHGPHRRPTPKLTELIQKQRAFCESIVICPLRFYDGVRCRWTGTRNKKVINHCIRRHEGLVKLGTKDNDPNFKVLVPPSRTSDLWVLYPKEGSLYVTLLTFDRVNRTVRYRPFFNGRPEDNGPMFSVNFRDGWTLEELSSEAPSYCEVTRQYRQSLNRNSRIFESPRSERPLYLLLKPPTPAPTTDEVS